MKHSSLPPWALRGNPRQSDQRELWSATQELRPQHLWINASAHRRNSCLGTRQEGALAEQPRGGQRQRTDFSGTFSHPLETGCRCRSYRWASLLSVSWTTSFPDPSFRRFSAHFYQTRVVVWPIFKTAFERANYQCRNTTLYNSNLPYDEGKKNNFSHYFSKRIKLLTRWDEQCFLIAWFLSECSLLHVYECLCSL